MRPLQGTVTTPGVKAVSIHHVAQVLPYSTLWPPSREMPLSLSQPAKKLRYSHKPCQCEGPSPSTTHYLCSGPSATTRQARPNLWCLLYLGTRSSFKENLNTYPFAGHKRVALAMFSSKQDFDDKQHCNSTINTRNGLQQQVLTPAKQISAQHYTLSSCRHLSASYTLRSDDSGSTAQILPATGSWPMSRQRSCRHCRCTHLGRHTSSTRQSTCTYRHFKCQAAAQISLKNVYKECMRTICST